MFVLAIISIVVVSPQNTAVTTVSGFRSLDSCTAAGKQLERGGSARIETKCIEVK